MDDFSDIPGSKTAEATYGRPVRQFSVFLQNRVGELAHLVKMLHQRSIYVIGLSVQDSSDFAILRVVVSDPEELEELFIEQNVAYVTSSLVVVEMKEGAAGLGHMLSMILMAEVNIDYSYPLLVRPDGEGLLALHVEDHECATEALRSGGFKTLTQHDLSR